ncbi:toll/interleukin-1 receptor domain-containing protein [Vibrio parahaemolyticus]|uniref:toll/interleukin-1 receptor domain-containing protein n=1 Tax=Vibrio TaxID=662 RepID=UPI00146F5D07|nr:MULTISPECIES: toll/interleukin-1 receptor domain-containing protein [Vibrio]EIK0773732.1 toll/interleukin-1 receptor domain-containing protein [Vibrio alginolyticus]EKB1969618.1 toll/interleukin-1 receptor domain-containing protein [Vibrio parahaemolyticus]MDF5089495.1 toll/interleukin-1 receptor domain-containing protein [Vibrio parahaemolyticus]MDF5138053.1 toll/interleukin-1 receptor domain-containing protein [Vibrio parahaemolyticus]MDW2263971.1 toll/interleukin-1 receptor domain-contai
MALIKESDLKGLITKNTKIDERSGTEGFDIESYDEKGSFDIFLSHSYLDKETVLGLKNYLANRGYSVYVDWIDDKELDRSKVSEETADRLRKRMKQCSSLFFATSTNSSSSKWMPWECGYFDALKGKVVILPITKNYETRFEGQEYLSLYPYIDATSQTLWVNDPTSGYCSFGEWLDGKSPKS